MSKYPSDWSATELQRVAIDFVVPMRDRPKEFKGSIPWIRIEDFTGKWVSRSRSGLCVDEEIISEMNLKVHPQGTVLCSCSANLGVCAITERPLITNQTFIGIVPNTAEINTEYLYYLMCSKASELQALSSGTTIAYLPRKKFEELEIVVPPLPEQKKIAEILSGIDLLVKATEVKVGKLKEARNALIQNIHLESPEEWVTLSEIADLVTSGSRGWSQYYSDTGSKFVRIGNLSRDSIDLDPAPDKWQLVAPPEGAEGARTKLKEGDILISITADLGICSIYSAAIGEAYINQHIALVRVDSGHIGYSRQIAYYICSDHCQEQIRSMNDSGAKAGLNLESIRRIRVPLIQGGKNNRVVRSIDALQSAISGNLLRLQHLAYEKSSLTSDLLSGRQRVSV